MLHLVDPVFLIKACQTSEEVSVADLGQRCLEGLDEQSSIIVGLDGVLVQDPVGLLEAVLEVLCCVLSYMFVVLHELLEICFLGLG